jgi:hypothetical protein
LIYHHQRDSMEAHLTIVFGLPLRRHQYHDRPAQPDRIPRGAPIRCSRCPFGHVTGRTNISGGCPMAASSNTTQKAAWQSPGKGQ